MSDPRRLALVGTGLIGGSIGLALGKAGYEVVGFDRDAERARGRGRGAVRSRASRRRSRDAVAGADLTVIAVPVGQVAAMVIEALDAGAPLVTDVGSVKAPVVTEVEAARPELRGALRRRSPDGGLRAGRPRRCRRRPLRRRHLGAHADRAHRSAGVRVGARDRRVARRGGDRGHARAARRRWSRS